ncbi:MAG: hypothetical protein BRD55_03855 [Bacteroidetes bacterium SW_9_63_38]|nr:MAG: hypothetical protein BRD55_03855 [Bacteroidetes bacterium SW_9_63_38]
MASWLDRAQNGLLNAALLVGGLVVVVLLYGLVTRTLVPPATPKRSTDSTTELVGTIIQVEVRNGAGVDHLAAEATHYLRDRGFDVVDVGNYKTFHQERSVVIDRVGDPEAARRVAEALGLPESRVRQEIRRQYYLDASVIIGHDYKQLRPFQGDD